MVSVDKILAEYLNYKFARRESDFWDREIGTYHATDTGKCLRQVYYEFELGRRERVDAYPHFHLGELIENYIERALVHHYGADIVKNSFRIKLKFNDLKIVGQTDPVLLGANAKPVKLFEVKSTKWLKFCEKEPSRHHVFQVHPYMKALNLDSCTIIYVQKSDLAVVPHVISFEEPIFQRGISRIRRLHRPLTRHKIPGAVPFGKWECKFCPYQGECESQFVTTRGNQKNGGSNQGEGASYLRKKWIDSKVGEMKPPLEEIGEIK